MTKFKILSQQKKKKKKKKKKCTATKNSEEEKVKSQHKVPRPTAESNRKDRGPSQLRVNRAQRPILEGCPCLAILSQTSSRTTWCDLSPLPTVWWVAYDPI